MNPNNQNSAVNPGIAPAVTQQAAKGKKSSNNSTQNLLKIAEIRDGIAIMNDASYRAVIMCKAINFDLMSQREQEAVEFSYQGFLNSLYFPVQIYIHSEQVNLSSYIEKLETLKAQHDNMLLSMLMDDYIGFIEQISGQTNIMDKDFYVVVPFFPGPEVKKNITTGSRNFITGFSDLFGSKEKHVVVSEADLEAAKNELRNRVQAVIQGLQQCGVKGLPLDTQELIELYYNVYNPDTASAQPLAPIDSLTVDVVEKGEGHAPKPNVSGMA
ncbi:MAG: hypothetical protein WCJ05_01785 [bacterium]